MNEEDIKNVLVSENEEYRKLLGEHKVLEAQLAELDSRVYMTPEEETERKKIQKLKLTKKDRMAEILREYKSSVAAG